MSGDNSHPLLHNVTLSSATIIVVGNIVGIGIFITPGMVALHTNTPLLFFSVWIVGGLFALAGAMSFAELGATMPEAGGDYVYLKKAFGPLVGFLSGWSSFLITFSGAIAAASVGFASYMDGLFPQITFEDNVLIIFSLKKIIAIVLIILLSFSNYLGVKFGSKIQNVIVVVKTIAILLIVFAGILLGGGRIEHFVQAKLIESNTSIIVSFGLAMIPVLYTYSGWNATTYIASEIKSPQKNIPASLFLGTFLAILLYLIMNSLYLYALPLGEISGTINIMETASLKLFSPGFTKYLTILVAISILGGLSTMIILGPRIYFAMAGDGLFFKTAADVNQKHRTPGKAIFIQCIWSSLLVLLGAFDQLLTYVVWIIILFSILTVSAIFILRKKYPEMNRPYKVWGYPYVPLLFILLSIFMLINTLIQRPYESLAGVGVLLLGVPVYYYFRSRKSENY